MLSGIGILVQGVALRQLAFRELPPTTTIPSSPPATRMNISLSLAGEINIFQADGSTSRGVEITITLQVRPDVAVKPIEVDVSMSAFFVGVEGVTIGTLIQYVNQAGGRFLFPYLREVVSAATSRCIYGPVFLDPITVGPLLAEEVVNKILRDNGEETA